MAQKKIIVTETIEHDGPLYRVYVDNRFVTTKGTLEAAKQAVQDIKFPPKPRIAYEETYED